MALVQGIHLLAHGDRNHARYIAVDIQTYQRLLIGPGAMDGPGAYAWHAHLLPPKLHGDPQVLFTIDDAKIIEVCRRRDGISRGYFRIPGTRIIGDYVSITVIAFQNVW
jgi:hypothetical protein